MGRWTQYDEDSYRLPEGMKRVGYDADTGRHYFKDSDGSLWEGPEGAEYGEMTKVSDASDTAVEDGDNGDIEAGSPRPDGYQPLATDKNNRPHHPSSSNASAYRALLPFFLLICVSLLLIFRLVRSPTLPSTPPDASFCPGGSTAYRVQKGDTCWELSRDKPFSLDDLMSSNPGMDCDKLVPGQVICLPGTTESQRRKI